MGKWIAVAVIFIFFVLPMPILIAVPPTTVVDLASAWLAPKEEVALARSAVEDVRLRKFQPVISAFDPKLALAKSPERLNALANLFPREMPKSIKLIGSNWDLKSAGRNPVKLYRFIYQYEFSDRWLVIEAVLYRENGRLQIYALTGQPLKQSLEQINALTLRGKTPAHYVFAAVAVVIYLFWLVSVYACLFTPIAKRKWLWVIFVLVGFGGVNMNWTSGEMGFALINVAVPATRLWTTPLTAWIIQISLPLGAILFWLRRPDLIARTEPDLRSIAVAPAP